MTRVPKNSAISIRERLVTRARERRENAHWLMTRYVVERLLFRLSISQHRDNFVLKGAMLFSLWSDDPDRATSDLDLSSAGANTPEKILSVFHDLLTIDVEGDGVVFRPDMLRASATRDDDDEFASIRLDLVAEIAGTRLPMHLDIDFGDAIALAPIEIEYPSMLGLSQAALRAYPPETVIAEKFQAIVASDLLNSCMKDLYDLWVIAHTFEFDGSLLARAIATTFAHRQTALPMTTPIALTRAFADQKQTQWAAFRSRTTIALAPEPFTEVLSQAEKLVMPPTSALARGEPFEARWTPGGFWK